MHALTLEPNDVRLAASLRLDIPPPFVDWNSQCECGKSVTGYHHLNASMVVGQCGTTMKFVNEWNCCLHELKIRHENKSASILRESNHTHVVVYNSGTSYELWLISLVRAQ